MRRGIDVGPLIVIALCSLAGCRCSGDTDSAPPWSRLQLGQPLEKGAKPATAAEMVRLSSHYYIKAVDHSQYTPREFREHLLSSSELEANKAVQRILLLNMAPWEALVTRVDEAVSSDFYVMSVTGPGDVAYALQIASLLPGPPDDRILRVHVSFMVPYYFYYVQHANRVNGLIEREPVRYEVTPLFEPVLAVIEREIAAQYGYPRMEPELAMTPVPGLYVPGHHTDDPPTLFDTMFTTIRW